MKKTMLFTLAMLCLPTVGLHPGILGPADFKDYTPVAYNNEPAVSCATAVSAFASFITVIGVAAASNNPTVGTISFASASGLLTGISYLVTIATCLKEPGRQERLTYTPIDPA